MIGCEMPVMAGAIKLKPISSLVHRMRVERRKLSCCARTCMFIGVYWRSLVVFLTPLLLLPLIIVYNTPVCLVTQPALVLASSGRCDCVGMVVRDV